MNADEYKAKRVAGSYTQATLADALGVSRDTIIRRESGEAVISKEAEMAINSLVPSAEFKVPKSARVDYRVGGPKPKFTAPALQPIQLKPVPMPDASRQPLGELALARLGRQPILRPGITK